MYAIFVAYKNMIITYISSYLVIAQVDKQEIESVKQNMLKLRKETIIFSYSPHLRIRNRKQSKHAQVATRYIRTGKQ